MLTLQPGDTEDESATEKLRGQHHWVSGKITAKLFQGRHKTLNSKIHKLGNSVWNMKEFPQK